MTDKQLHTAREVAIVITAVLGLLVGVTWLADRAGWVDGTRIMEVLAALTAIGGVTIGLFYSIHPKRDGDRDRAPRAASAAGNRTLKTVLVFVVALSGVMIGFLDPGPAQTAFLALASVGGIALGVVWLLGRRATAN